MMDIPKEFNNTADHVIHLVVNEVQLKHYDGTRDFDNFLTHFYAVSKANKWSKEMCYQRFCCALRGSALTLLSSVPRGEIKNLDELIDRFRSYFASSSKTMLRTELRHIKRKKGQPLRDLAIYIRKTAYMGISKMNNEYLETICIDTFIASLDNDEQLKYEMELRKEIFKTLDECLKQAVHLEYVIQDFHNSIDLTEVVHRNKSVLTVEIPGNRKVLPDQYVEHHDLQRYDLEKHSVIQSANTNIKPCIICNQGAMHMLKLCPQRHMDSSGKKNACFKCGHSGHHVHQCSK